jgi:hypothetical protein
LQEQQHLLQLLLLLHCQLAARLLMPTVRLLLTRAWCQPALLMPVGTGLVAADVLLLRLIPGTHCCAAAAAAAAAACCH